MGNCLVTRLKAAVNNSDLEYFNAIKILSSGDRGSMSAGIGLYTDSSDVSVKVKIISGNGSFDDSSIITEKNVETVVTDEVYKFRGGTGIRSLDGQPVTVLLDGTDIGNITGIYNVENLNLSKLFMCVPNIKYVKINEKASAQNNNVITIDKLSDIPATMEELRLFNTGKMNQTSDVSTLARLTNANTIELANIENIIGNISSLKNLTKLTYLNLAYTSVSGTVEDFAAGQVAAGRTSGSMVFRVYGGNVKVTYQGSPTTYNTTVEFGSSHPGGYKVTVA